MDMVDMNHEEINDECLLHLDTYQDQHTKLQVCFQDFLLDFLIVVEDDTTVMDITNKKCSNFEHFLCDIIKSKGIFINSIFDIF